MANEKNLIPFTSEQNREEAKKNGRKGGIESGKVRREQKTVRKILDEIMKSDIKEYPQVAKLAQKLGIESDKSVKDIFTLVATLNTLKAAKLSDLEQLGYLLGEKNEESGNNGILNELSKYLKGDNNVDK